MVVPVPLDPGALLVAWLFPVEWAEAGAELPVLGALPALWPPWWDGAAAPCPALAGRCPAVAGVCPAEAG